MRRAHWRLAGGCPQVEEALDFAQDTLAPLGEDDPSLLPELEEVLALLAFPDAAFSPLASLLLPEQRQKVASELNSAILATQVSHGGLAMVNASCGERVDALTLPL